MKAKYAVSGIFLFTLMMFMFSVLFTVTLKVNNKVKRLEEYQEIKIDWEKLYPFEIEDRKEPERRESIAEKVYLYVKEKCRKYLSEKLIGYYSIVESAKLYEDYVGWNMASAFDYNAVVKLHDGYLTSYIESRDITENARSTIELAEFCRKNGIDFFYANLPTKICISEDRNISGVLDFSNQNADRFLEMLGEAGVKYYDFRKILHEYGMNHHDAFFVTDHHWKPETGLWAARHILKILRDDYGWDVNPNVLNPDRFDYVIYPEWFLGSQGKKITHARTKPDDFTMIYPKFTTSLHYEIPSAGINVSGDFAVTYDMRHVESRDYYSRNPYAAYNHADKPLIRIENRKLDDGRKILVVHDSVSNCVIPFIAMEIQYIDSIDLRHFTGSLRNFIKQEKPDKVIVMYYGEIPGRNAGHSPSDTNKKFYDFR